MREWHWHEWTRVNDHLLCPACGRTRRRRTRRGETTTPEYQTDTGQQPGDATSSQDIPHPETGPNLP